MIRIRAATKQLLRERGRVFLRKGSARRHSANRELMTLYLSCGTKSKLFVNTILRQQVIEKSEPENADSTEGYIECSPFCFLLKIIAHYFRFLAFSGLLSYIH